MQQAKQALESPRLTGEAVIKEAGSGAHEDQNVPPNQGFDMGQVSASCLPVAKTPFVRTFVGVKVLYQCVPLSVACKLHDPLDS